MNENQKIRALKIREVEAITRLSASTISRREKAGEFPPRRRTGHCVFWLETDISAFLESRQPAGREDLTVGA